MKIFDRIGSAYRAFRSPDIGVMKKDSPFTSPRWGDYSFSSRTQIVNDQAVYEGSLPWFSIGVDAVVRDIRSQSYYFSDLQGKRLDPRVVPDEIKAPLEMSYRGLSFMDRMEFIVSNLMSVGNAYFWCVEATAWGLSNDICDTFIPLSGNDVKICLSKDGMGIEHYEVKMGNNRYIVEPDEMIHFKQNAFINPFIGIGNIAKMRIMAEGELAAAEYLNTFLTESSKMPLATLIEGGARLEDDQQRIKEVLKLKYSDKIMYINGDNTTFTQSSLLQKDLQYVDLRKESRQTILSMCGVPPVVVGIPDGSNRAISDNQYSGYYKNTINPKLIYFSEVLNNCHVKKYSDKILINFVLHPTGDTEDLISKVQNGIITPNRAAELCGEEFDSNDESREQFYFPSSYVPLGYVAPDPSSQQQVPTVQGANLLDPRNIDQICDHFYKSASRPKRFQRKYLYAALKSRNAVEDKYVGKVSDFFKNQSKKILQNLNSYASKSVKANIDDLTVGVLYDGADDEEAFNEIMKALHTSGIQKGVGDLNSIMGSHVNMNTSNPFIRAAISRLGSKIKGRVEDTTKQELQSIITTAVNESWNINDIQDRIQEKFTQFQGYRARMIARTEARYAWDAAAHVVYSDLGIKTVDVVGCTKTFEEEGGGDCGRQNIPIAQVAMLEFHPNHVGAIAPSEDPSNYS